MKWIWLLVFASCFAAAQTPTVTYRDDSRTYIGFRAGYIEVEDVDSGNFSGGISGGLRLIAPLWLDAAVDYSDGDVTIGGVSFVFANRESFAFQLGLILQSPKDRVFKPYLTGGVGYFIADYAGGGFYVDANNGDAGSYAGGGFELFIEPRISIVADGRLFFTQEEEFAEQTVRADGVQATLGVKYRF